MKNRTTLLKALCAPLAALSLLSLPILAQARPVAKTANAQKVAKLKEELSTAKGQKRVKLIKKIAEMENKVLEHKLQSFR